MNNSNFVLVRVLSSYLDHPYLLHYKSPTALSQCIILPVESAPFFVPSTSFCSLSSWFTSSCACHLITVRVTIFVLTICHSLDLYLKLISFLHSHCYSSRNAWIKGALAFVCFSFWLCVLAEYSAFESTLNRIVSKCTCVCSLRVVLS